MVNINNISLKIKNFSIPHKRIDKWIIDAINIINNANQEEQYLNSTFSRTRIKNLILSGNVFIDNVKVLNPSNKINNANEILIKFPKPIDALPKPENISIEIIYEDKHLIVLNKQDNLVVHPAPGNESGTLVNAILYHCNNLSGIGGVKRPGIVHRLDKDTSGLMLVAKSEIAHIKLVKMFQNHEIDRKYLGLIWGVPERIGMIDKPISRSSFNRKKMTVSDKGKFALTKWRVLQVLSDIVALTEFKLETGRTHQIRVHMCSLGYNLIGDKLYGKKSYKFLKNGNYNLEKFNDAILFQRQALHSYKISFKHPITEKSMSFQSEPPRDIQQLIKKLN